jgi:hypothetical protein
MLNTLLRPVDFREPLFHNKFHESGSWLQLDEQTQRAKMSSAGTGFHEDIYCLPRGAGYDGPPAGWLALRLLASQLFDERCEGWNGHAY